MESLEFKPGFRIDAIDASALAVAGIAALFAGRIEGWMGFTIIFATGHFFLFCKVCRVRRSLELAWAAVFVSGAGATILVGEPGWPATAAGSLCLTVVVIAVQMRQPSYHGIGWRRINPDLPAWWEAEAVARRNPACAARAGDRSGS